MGDRFKTESVIGMGQNMHLAPGCSARISTTDQNLDRQLPEMHCDRSYTEKVSGKNMDRPQLQALLQNLRKGDRVHVHELSRLGRSVKDLLEIVEQIVQKGASIKFHKESLEFEGNEKNPFQSLMLNLLSSIAQFERDCLLDRQREGIRIGQAKGHYKGKKSRFTEEDIQQIKSSFNKAKNKVELAKKWGISRGYLYQLAKDC